MSICKRQRRLSAHELIYHANQTQIGRWFVFSKVSLFTNVQTLQIYFYHLNHATLELEIGFSSSQRKTNFNESKEIG